MRQYKEETRILAFAISVLFVNILILHKTFSGLERENTIDPGGTDFGESPLFPNGQYPSDKYRIFESRLRKLTEISQDTGLDTEYNEFPSHNYIQKSDQTLDCNDILSMTNRRYIASGWTKAVYSGDFRNQSYAIKTVSPQGRDVSACQEKGNSFNVCYEKANRKIIKENSLLMLLSHPNIVKVLGFCPPKSAYDQNVAMVTELGESIELIRLLQMSWEDRLKIAYDMTKLVYFMAHNQFGSIAINDFRRQQFVRVNYTLKLSDIDDIGFGDPSCETDGDCTIIFPSVNFSQRLSCLNSRCIGFNEKRNIFNGGRHFTTFLLPHGAPSKLETFINRVVDGYSNLTMNIRELLTLMEKIVLIYSTGSYLDRNKVDKNSTYKRIPQQDIRDNYDYICRLSLTGTGCTVSVFDLKEAEDLCNSDSECKAFVVTNQKTWTGHTVVHLKSGTGSPTHNKDTSIYLKPT